MYILKFRKNDLKMKFSLIFNLGHKELNNLIQLTSEFLFYNLLDYVKFLSLKIADDKNNITTVRYM